MSEFEYLSDENIFNLDIEIIYYKWRLLNFLRIEIYSESIIDIEKDKNFLKMVYAISSSVQGYIYVTEFIPNIRSGLYSNDKWSGFLSI